MKIKLSRLHGGRPVFYPIRDFNEASAIVSAYIKSNGYIGASVFTGGKIINDINDIGLGCRVSYNGRVWDAEGFEIPVDKDRVKECEEAYLKVFNAYN